MSAGFPMTPAQHARTVAAAAPADDNGDAGYAPAQEHGLGPALRLSTTASPAVSPVSAPRSTRSLAGDAQPQGSPRAGGATWPPKAAWQPDSASACCTLCSAGFTFVARRHHCRACGQLFCEPCSSYSLADPRRRHKSVRVCRLCYQFTLLNPVVVETLEDGLQARAAADAALLQQQQQQLSNQSSGNQ